MLICHSEGRRIRRPESLPRGGEAELLSTHERVVELLVDVTRADEVRTDPELPLYERGIIDSLGTVELLLAITQEFAVDISPTEIDHAAWATPRKIAEFVALRLTR